MLSQERPLAVNLPHLSRDKFYQAFLSLNFCGKGSTAREEGLGTRLMESSKKTATKIWVLHALSGLPMPLPPQVWEELIPPPPVLTLQMWVSFPQVWVGQPYHPLRCPSLPPPPPSLPSTSPSGVGGASILRHGGQLH